MNDLDNLPSNDLHGPRRPQGRVRTRQNSVSTTVANGIRDISNTLFTDIILPELRSLAVNFFQSGIEMIFYGNTSTSGRGRSINRDYGGYSKRNRRGGSKRVRSVRNHSPNSGMEVNDIVFDEAADAKLVLATMHQRIAEYEWATVADLYEICGLTVMKTHSNWGWTDLSTGRVKNTMDGWVLDLPEPEGLD